MKQIGYLEATGNVLVECSEAEVKAYRWLAAIAQGKRMSPAVELDRKPLDADLATVLGAIAEWFEVKNHANELRRLADQIDATITRPAAPTEAR